MVVGQAADGHAGVELASLLTKIGARNRVEIAMWAYETGRVVDWRWR